MAGIARPVQNAGLHGFGAALKYADKKSPNLGAFGQIVCNQKEYLTPTNAALPAKKRFNWLLAELGVV